jgi:hypothetical protein
MYHLTPQMLEVLHAERRGRLLAEAGDRRLRRERRSNRRVRLQWLSWPAHPIRRWRVAHQRATSAPAWEGSTMSPLDEFGPASEHLGTVDLDEVA